MDANTVAFKESAQGYCSLVETLTKLDQVEALERVLDALAELYSVGLRIPIGKPSKTRYQDQIGSNEDGELRKQLHAFFGDSDYYWMLFDPNTKLPGEPVAGSFSDDFSDIWLDVKRGLLTLESSPVASLRDVQWSWRFSQQSHWGLHALSAMFAMQQLIYY